jgi:hypothetical protein
VTLLEFLYSAEPRQALALTLGASILVYTFFSNLAWTNRIPRTGRWGRFITWTQTSRIARVIGELLRWVYYLGLPWTVLMVGYTTARAIGIWNLDWGGHLVEFAALAIGSIIVFIWIWRPYTQLEHPHAIDESGWNWARHLIEILYQEAHWAFYRCGPILWLDSVYFGSFFGLILVLMEGWSNANVRANTSDVTRADAPLWSGSLAIVSALVFIITQNTWYCLIIHLLLDVGLRRAIGFPRTVEHEA